MGKATLGGSSEDCCYSSDTSSYTDTSMRHFDDTSHGKLARLQETERRSQDNTEDYHSEHHSSDESSDTEVSEMLCERVHPRLNVWHPDHSKVEDESSVIEQRNDTENNYDSTHSEVQTNRSRVLNGICSFDENKVALNSIQNDVRERISRNALNLSNIGAGRVVSKQNNTEKTRLDIENSALVNWIPNGIAIRASDHQLNLSVPLMNVFVGDFRSIDRDGNFPVDEVMVDAPADNVHVDDILPDAHQNVLPDAPENNVLVNDIPPDVPGNNISFNNILPDTYENNVLVNYILSDAPENNVPAQDILTYAPEDNVPNNDIPPDVPENSISNNDILPDVPENIVPANDILPDVPENIVPANDILPDVPENIVPANDILPDVPENIVPANDILPDVPENIVPANDILADAPENIVPANDILADAPENNVPAEAPLVGAPEARAVPAIAPAEVIAVDEAPDGRSAVAADETSAKKEPTSLQSLALDVSLSRLACQVWSWRDDGEDASHRRLCAAAFRREVPAQIRHLLQRRVLQEWRVWDTVQVRLLQLLLWRDCCTSLRVQQVRLFFRDPFLNLLPHLSRLTDLTIQDSSWRLQGDQENLLCQAVSCMPLLRLLSLRYLATDVVLAAVADNCHNLQVLDVFCSSGVTMEGAERLLGRQPHPQQKPRARRRWLPYVYSHLRGIIRGAAAKKSKRGSSIVSLPISDSQMFDRESRRKRSSSQPLPRPVGEQSGPDDHPLDTCATTPALSIPTVLPKLLYLDLRGTKVTPEEAKQIDALLPLAEVLYINSPSEN